MLPRHCSLFLRCAALLLAAALAALPAAAAEETLRRWPGSARVPTLQLDGFDGKQWTGNDLRGKVVVLNFWASWCAPCVEELPVLNELAHGAAAQGKLVVLGVNYKESAEAIERFAKAHPFDYPVLRDKTGEQFKKWTGGVLPTTVLIDRNGRPRWLVVGQLDPADARFRQTLHNLLQE